MFSARFENLFGGPSRRANEPLTQRHKDLAASIQRVTEEVMLKTCTHLHQKTGEAYLCMAGGVALNSVVNGRVLGESGFEDLWIQPAAGDAGGALGAALVAWYQSLDQGRSSSGRDHQQNCFLGTGYTGAEIRGYLQSRQAHFQELEDQSLRQETARVLSEGAVVGWFQGRMEFGPRALGNRSILADPRRADMKDLINRRIKYREGFRPFAPSIPQDRLGQYFELDRASPYMLLVSPVHPHRRAEIPSVTHVDGSARVQTVTLNENPEFHRLLLEFERQTGCPVLLNTSFNVRGEPIVESPDDAYQCFMRTGMDYLVLEDCFLAKHEQPLGLEA